MKSSNLKNLFEKEIKTGADKKIFYDCLKKHCSTQQVNDILNEFLVIKGKKLFPKKKTVNNIFEQEKPKPKLISSFFSKNYKLQNNILIPELYSIKNDSIEDDSIEDDSIENDSIKKLIIKI
jgi:hypothetical protein